MSAVLENAATLELGLPWRHSFAALGPAFYTELAPLPLPDPYLVGVNAQLAGDLGLDAALLASPEGINAFLRAAPPNGSRLPATYSRDRSPTPCRCSAPCFAG